MPNIDKLLNTIFSNKEKVNVKEIFDCKLKEYNLSKTRALKLLNVDKDVFEDIISGKARQPNLINVIKIAEFLDFELDQFIDIVLENQNCENIASIDNARKTIFLLKNFDVNTLTKLGFFSKSDNTEQLVDKVLSFFGFTEMSEYEEFAAEPLYSKIKRKSSDKMRDFWVKSAHQCFKRIDNPNPYNREELKNLIVKIKPYSQDLENGLLTVSKALYSIGITIIFQSYLSTTQVRGGTFIINGNPCIVLTDFNKKYPTIWFTLIHELHHVIFDYDVIETNGYHLTGENDLFLIEEKADSFARNFFLTEGKFHFIKKYITNPYLVSKFAKENEIHISIVYSFYTWYQDKLSGGNYHGVFNEFYPKYSKALEKLNPIVWESTNISEASTKIKSVLEIK